MAEVIETRKGTGRARPQVRKRRRSGVTERRLAKFFDALSRTANVRVSAKIAGLSTTTVYKFKRTMPVFLERFEAAISEGYTQVELLLLEQALGGSGLCDEDEGAGAGAGAGGEGSVEAAIARLPVMSNADRMRLLRQHREKKIAIDAKRASLAEESPEEFRAGFERKMRAMRARLLGEALPEESAPEESGPEEASSGGAPTDGALSGEGRHEAQ